MYMKKKICKNCNKGFNWVRAMGAYTMNCSPKCHSEWMSKKRVTVGNPNWKGNKASKLGIHRWINRNFPRLNICSACKKKGSTDYSNKYHTYKRLIEDWQELCRSCHQKYDYKNGLRIWSKTFKKIS